MSNKQDLKRKAAIDAFMQNLHKHSASVKQTVASLKATTERSNAIAAKVSKQRLAK
ncbi:hypothetical protein IOU64_004438 [Salmonella enterica]|nr:hypothetical protein [Salmonella enterica]